MSVTAFIDQHFVSPFDIEVLCTVALIKLVVGCCFDIHITASFDERKGVLIAICIAAISVAVLLFLINYLCKYFLSS